MKKSQFNRLSMLYAVRKVCNKHNAVWIVLPAYVNGFSALEVVITMIEDALRQQETDISGITLDRNYLKEAMIESALVIGQAVHAYADASNDQALLSKVDYSSSDLKHVRDSLALQRCKVIHEEADKVIASLGNYGINATMLAGLDNALTVFEGMLAATRDAITGRKVATADIPKLLSQRSRILSNRLDKLMVQFKHTAPVFYQHYFNSRIVVDYGTGKGNAGNNDSPISGPPPGDPGGPVASIP